MSAEQTQQEASNDSELDIDTLELINTEIADSSGRQVDSGTSIDTKSIVLVGYAIAASSFLATHRAQPVLALLAYLAYAAAVGFGISAYAVRLYLDVPTPRHLFYSYLERSKADTLAALAATRVEVFEKNAAKQKRKATRWLVSLISLVVGATAMLLALTSAYWQP